MAVRGIQLKGVDKLLKNLKSLETKLQRKILRQNLRPGAKIIAAEAKREAPVLSGNLRGSIKVRAGKRKRGTIRLVVMTGDVLFKGKQFYGAFIELGRRIGKRSSGVLAAQRVRHRRVRASLLEKADTRERVEPNPFMRRAFDNKVDEAARVITTGIARDIEAAARER